jgi:hypothetical protein
MQDGNEFKSSVDSGDMEFQWALSEAKKFMIRFSKMEYKIPPHLIEHTLKPEVSHFAYS